MLSLKQTRTSTVPRRSRATTVVVKAWNVREATDWVTQGFLRIFSPPTTNVEKWPVNSGYKGRVDHSAHRPFKDGYASNTPLPPSSALEPAHEDAAGYVEDAVKGVVAGLPSEAASQPKQWPEGSAWKGEIHKSGGNRDTREGFHVKKY